MMINLESITTARLAKMVRDLAVGLGGGKGEDIQSVEFLPFPDLMRPKKEAGADHLKLLFNRLVSDGQLPLHVATAIGKELGVT
jgi:hypothetical protein